MKTMPILTAMLLAGSAMATDWPDAVRPSFDIRKCDITPVVTGLEPRDKPAPQVNEEAYRPSKVDYSIITLPDGKTASVLTFK